VDLQSPGELPEERPGQPSEPAEEPVAEEPVAEEPAAEATPPAEPARRPNRRLAVLSGVAGLVVGALLASAVWLVGPSGHRSTAVPAAATTSLAPAPRSGACVWQPASGPDRKDVGTPPPTATPRSGKATMTVTTNLGRIVIEMDPAKTPCAVASFSYLAGRHFFDNSTCHRLVQVNIGILQCGDPTGTGQGGPTYRFADENLASLPSREEIDGHPLLTLGPSDLADLCKSLGAPADCMTTEVPLSICPKCRVGWGGPGGTPWPGGTPGPVPSPTSARYYPRGTVALVNTGPDTNGSQFFLVYGDGALPPAYPPFGVVTSGLDILDKVAQGGDDRSYALQPGGGRPNTKVIIQSVTVS
jgi:peptidyl-prolyl cis-trans isomerase B (cyclophilin B)